MFYLFTVTWCDGNDASNTDCIVEADSKDSAHEKLWNHYKKQFDEKYIDYVEEFDDPPCFWENRDCTCEDVCLCERESLTIPYECEEFQTVLEAEQNRDKFHSYEGLIE
jgi:hypothetical protein